MWKLNLRRWSESAVICYSSWTLAALLAGTPSVQGNPVVVDAVVTNLLGEVNSGFEDAMGPSRGDWDGVIDFVAGFYGNSSIQAIVNENKKANTVSVAMPVPQPPDRDSPWLFSFDYAGFEPANQRVAIDLSYEVVNETTAQTLVTGTVRAIADHWQSELWTDYLDGNLVSRGNILQVRFTAEAFSGGPRGSAILDNVVLQAVLTPEPSSHLCGVVLMAIAILRRSLRRRK